MTFKNPSSVAFSGLCWPFRRPLVKQTDAVLKHALSTHTYHGLRTSNGVMNQRDLKIWVNVADKICFGCTKKFGNRSRFLAVQ